MKNLSVIAVILLFVPIQLNSQIIDDSTLQWVVYWEPGDTFQYMVKQQKIKIQGVDTTTSSEYSYDLTLAVMDTSKSKITLSATYSNFNTTQTDAVTAEILKTGEGLRVIYTTNGFGAFHEIVNSEEVIRFLKTTIQPLLDKAGQNTDVKNNLQQLLSKMATKEGLEGGGIDEIHFLHSGIGYQYVLGKDYDESISLPSNFGGTAFEGIQTLRLLEIDSTEKTAMLKIITDLDGAQVRRETIQFLKSMMPAESQKDFKEDQVPEMYVQHRLVNLFHYEYGWNLYSYNIKEVEAGGIISMEVTEISLK